MSHDRTRPHSFLPEAAAVFSFRAARRNLSRTTAKRARTNPRSRRGSSSVQDWPELSLHRDGERDGQVASSRRENPISAPAAPPPPAIPATTPPLLCNAAAYAVALNTAGVSPPRAAELLFRQPRRAAAAAAAPHARRPCRRRPRPAGRRQQCPLAGPAGRLPRAEHGAGALVGPALCVHVPGRAAARSCDGGGGGEVGRRAAVPRDGGVSGYSMGWWFRGPGVGGRATDGLIRSAF
jgi:hypothetical protein